jgi:hypothetical protein
VEGIRGLNPALSVAIPAEATLKIDISALTQLSLDDHNRSMTTDVRLIRRLMRGRKSRGHTAYRTLPFLCMFVPVYADETPHASILREFAGGSTFED